MLIQTAQRCKRCHGKLELAAKGEFLICPACKIGTRITSPRDPTTLLIFSQVGTEKGPDRSGVYRIK